MLACSYSLTFSSSSLSQQNPILDAELATPCGHSFCGFCVNILRSRNQGQSSRCEICRQLVTTFCPNRLANVALGMVHGYCKWCESEITLNQAKDHLERCPELEVSYQQCQESIKQKEMDAHRSTCLMMDVVCECGIRFKTRYKQNHQDLFCSFTVVPCPLKCGENIIR